MSSVLVRQALEFVDPDISGSKKKRGGKAKAASAGRVKKQTKKPKSGSKQEKEDSAPVAVPCERSEQSRTIRQEVIDRLLKLSQPVVDKNTANRIAKRVVKGKPLVDKIKVNKEPQKSILFPEV